MHHKKDADMILITGGARSGKSSFALGMARATGGGVTKRAFVATAKATDDEMIKRIENHKAQRKGEFDTFEEHEYLAGLLESIAYIYDVILIDCVTLFINNLMFYGKADEEIADHFDSVIKIIKGAGAKVIIVTNEVGLGIVPDNPLARRFIDLQGKVNQQLAASCSEVFLMTSGIPVKIK